jgi:hypothetical protein
LGSDESFLEHEKHYRENKPDDRKEQQAPDDADDPNDPPSAAQSSTNLNDGQCRNAKVHDAKEDGDEYLGGSRCDADQHLEFLARQAN